MFALARKARGGHAGVCSPFLLATVKSPPIKLMHENKGITLPGSLRYRYPSRHQPPPFLSLLGLLLSYLCFLVCFGLLLNLQLCRQRDAGRWCRQMCSSPKSLWSITTTRRTRLRMERTKQEALCDSPGHEDTKVTHLSERSRVARAAG